MSSLVLGTAQLGRTYGVANITGQPDQKTATEIVRCAWEGGIREFDTAQEYGDSEAVLGKAFRSLGIASKAQVVSKLNKHLNLSNTHDLERAIDSSLDQLGVPMLFVLLLHKEELLNQWDHFVISPVVRARVRHFGVSVYSPQRAIQALKTPGMDALQFPSNLLDRRFEISNLVENHPTHSIYIRSVFLQGLLLMDPAVLPPHLAPARSVLEIVGRIAEEFGLTKIEMALGYCRHVFSSGRIIVGAETPRQVREIIAAWNIPVAPNTVDRIRHAFPAVDERILNPRVWPKIH